MAAAYAIALAVVTLFGLNHFWLAWKVARSRRLVEGPVPSSGLGAERPVNPPRVTVQIPLYNEALVADRVIAACARLDYPRDLLEIQVLDDSTDETVGISARAVRFWKTKGVRIVHLRRTHRHGFKAGALAEGLKVAQGELIAMFDADFVPPRDFLLRLVPHFGSREVGFVQARWTHLNDGNSLLTRLQGFGLDAHFALEQEARQAAGYPAGFNGTAGIWRRACIEDAGGWSADTLTEDLDLSYRAQLKGWRMVYLNGVGVPAELPIEMGGFRAQQHRWTKGAMQTALKLLGRVLTSGRAAGFRLQGTAHLSATVAYPFVLLLAVLHAPLSLRHAAGTGPGEVYFSLLGFGLLGFAGFFSAHVMAQRTLYHDWSLRLMLFPLFLASSMGMALSNSAAVLEALLGRKTPFIRTPKFSSVNHQDGTAWWRTGYARARLGWMDAAELGLAAYLTFGLVQLVRAGAVASIPFQILFVAGAWLVVLFSLRDAGLTRRMLISARE